MIRGLLYLLVSLVIWCTEAGLFSLLLNFSAGQTAALFLLYVLLATVVIGSFVRQTRARHGPIQDMPQWRYMSLGPMLVTIVGSFVSLPLLLFVAVAGKLL